MLMITPEDVQRNIPKAMRWVTQSEQACMEIGQQLSPQRKRDAQAIGVQQIGVVRIMLSNEIPLPDDPELRQSFYKAASAAAEELRSAMALFSSLALTIAI